MKKNLLLIASVVTLAAGCASPITKQDQASLAQPIIAPRPRATCVSCSPRRRMWARRSRTASVHRPHQSGRRISSTRTEKARFEVGTGDYNKMIDKKMAEIKAQCPM